MYDSKVIDIRLSKLADALRVKDPSFSFHPYSIPEIEEWVEHLDALYDPDTDALRRPLTAEEERFILNEVMRSKVDFPHWLRSYCFIKTKAQTLRRVHLLQSQEILMNHISKEERASLEGIHHNGVILMVLKARQVGASTLSEAIISHRVFFYANTTGLVAADIESQSAYLFDMMERILDNLPWWMRPRSVDPKRDYRVKDKQLYFGDQDSLLIVEHSKSVRGGESGRQKGSMGTGRTYPLAHLSELALWENASQIDDALMPSIPKHPRTFAIFESTAKGRGNWWHDAWLAAKKGIGVRKPVFIPWYVMGRDIASEDITYSQPPPPGWKPMELTLAHAQRVRDTSAQWCGQTIDLTPSQMYWWESTRADYKERKKLHDFLAEYAADDMEAFQNTTLSVFKNEMISDMRNFAKEPRALVEIVPRTQLR